MKQTSKTVDKDRRKFLKLAAASAPAAAATAALAPAGTAAAEPDEQGSGLQDTAHVRTYYETARF